MTKEQKLWREVPEESHTAWLTLHDPEGWYTAGVKFDGCVHLHRYFNLPRHLRTKQDDERDAPDYYHICDIDEEIARLQAIKALALEYFGEHWPA